MKSACPNHLQNDTTRTLETFELNIPDGPKFAEEIKQFVWCDVVAGPRQYNLSRIFSLYGGGQRCLCLWTGEQQTLDF